MDDGLYKRVRALAIAGWCTALISTIWGTAVWLIWLALTKAEPAWVLGLWGGGDLAWSEVRRLVLAFFGVMKLMLWAWVMATICVSLWARRLKRIT
jgi:hypothetical protein